MSANRMQGERQERQSSWTERVQSKNLSGPSPSSQDYFVLNLIVSFKAERVPQWSLKIGACFWMQCTSPKLLHYSPSTTIKAVDTRLEMLYSGERITEHEAVPKHGLATTFGVLGIATVSNVC